MCRWGGRGPAAPYLRQYIDLVHRPFSNGRGAHIHCGLSPSTNPGNDLPYPLSLPGSVPQMRADPRGPAPAESVPLSRWFGQPELDEAGLRWARPAHHWQRGIARGGLLFMTEERLGFVPRGIDALFGARAASWELSSITDVHLKPSLRKLRVTVTTDRGRQRLAQ